jgi:hypothetical protein
MAIPAPASVEVGLGEAGILAASGCQNRAQGKTDPESGPGPM